MATKRRGLPTDYLDATVATRAVAHAPTPAAPPARAKLTFYLPPALLAELRAASRALAGPPTYCTGPSELVVAAVERHLETLRKQHHKGRPFAAVAPTTALRGNPTHRRRPQ